MAFRLAACAEMLFPELPFLDRVRRIHDRGFEVEIWDWSTKDLDALARTGATISSMTGYLRGDLTTEHGTAQLLEGARASTAVAERLGVTRLNLHGTGLGPDGLPVGPVRSVASADWLLAADTLSRIAEIGEQTGRTFMLENLNTTLNHPGTPFARVADTLALVASVDSPALRMNLDLYHARTGEEDAIDLIRRHLPWLGEVQVAAIHESAEPDARPIRYRSVAADLRAVGYDGVVGLESWGRGDSDAALTDFAAAFTG